MNNFDYGAPATPSPEKEQLMPPAIGLIVTGAINASAALLALLSGVLRLMRNTPAQQFASDAERLGYIVSTVVLYGVAVVSLILAPVVIAGGITMLRGKNMGLSRSAAILAMIPVTSCCCIVGIPVGIWAFRTLKKPEIVAWFGRQTADSSGRPFQ